jgi:hypothetical protein
VHFVFQNSGSLTQAASCRHDSQQQSDREKCTSEVDGGFCQNGGSLGAEDVFCDPTAEGGAESFIPWSLHQHDKCQQDAHDHQDRKENWNEDIQPHSKGRNM